MYDLRKDLKYVKDPFAPLATFEQEAGHTGPTQEAILWKSESCLP